MIVRAQRKNSVATYLRFPSMRRERDWLNPLARFRRSGFQGSRSGMPASGPRAYAALSALAPPARPYLCKGGW